MDGIHDLGGMDGFGPVDVERDEPVFHAAWERTVFGLVIGRAVAGLGGTDEFRHAIERMDPAHYLASSYYEHWLTGLATLLVERGIVTPAELARRAGGAFPLSRPVAGGAPAAGAPVAAPRFAPGDRVRVRNVQTRGHTRCPRYVRGHAGIVVRVDAASPVPDVAAHAAGAPAEPAYGVRFLARDLWGDDADERTTVTVDLWDRYLEAP